MKKRILGLQALAVGLVLLGAARSASAGLVPVFLNETTTATTSTFNYSLNFTSNGSTESLTSGDFFTLYDVGTYTASSINPNFTLSSALTGVTPAFTAPPDSAVILNITGTYGGAATITADTSITVSLTFPGVLSTKTGYYSSTDTISLGKNNQVGLVTVPAVVVPEPTTVAAFAVGGVLAGALAFRRRRLAA